MRRDLETMEHLVALRAHDSAASWFRNGMLMGRFAALAALDDRRTVEEEAPEFLRPNTLLEAFALRALGLVRQDEELLRRALERFEAMGMDVPAEETRALLSGGA